MSETIITPKGTARYPWLNKADTKWHELGEYKVDLLIPKADAEPLIKMIEEKFAQTKAMNKSKKDAPRPYFADVTEDGDETGMVVFKCKNKNRINSKTGEVWDRKPIIVDAKGKPCDPNIGGGSKLRLKLELYGWSNAALGTGVSLQIKAVQIVELQEIVRTADFGEVEGFEADEEDAPIQEGEEQDLF